MAKKPRIQATVGPFTFAYPHLTAPDSEGTYADNKYKVDGVVDPTSPAGKAVQAEVSKALKALGLGKDAQLPLKKQTEKDEKGKKVPTGKLVFRTKSQYAPVIADVTGKPIPEKQLKSLTIGAGRSEKRRVGTEGGRTCN